MKQKTLKVKLNEKHLLKIKGGGLDEVGILTMFNVVKKKKLNKALRGY